MHMLSKNNSAGFKRTFIILLYSTYCFFIGFDVSLESELSVKQSYSKRKVVRSCSYRYFLDLRATAKQAFHTRVNVQCDQYLRDLRLLLLFFKSYRRLFKNF